MSNTIFGSSTPAKKPVVALVVAVALALLLLVVLLQVPSRPAHAAAERLPGLPDLSMLHPKGLEIVNNTSAGRRELRFQSIIVNVGEGNFELRGESNNDPYLETVTQRIYDDAGGYQPVVTGARMEYGGDGHDHWHVKDLMDFELVRLDNGSKVGTWEKRGFCFFDNYRFGSTADRFYVQANGDRNDRFSSCGPRDSSATVTSMGLSPGWGDRYGKRLPDQYIDITDLTAGSYRLIGRADAEGWFTEEYEDNNESWVDIRLTADNRVRIVAYGPSA